MRTGLSIEPLHEIKLILAMYTKEPNEENTTATPLVYYIVGVVAIVLNILIGIYPELLTNLLK